MYSQMYTDYTPVSQFMKFLRDFMINFLSVLPPKRRPIPGRQDAKIVPTNQVDNAPVKNIGSVSLDVPVFSELNPKIVERMSYYKSDSDEADSTRLFGARSPLGEEKITNNCFLEMDEISNSNRSNEAIYQYVQTNQPDAEESLPLSADDKTIVRNYLFNEKEFKEDMFIDYESLSDLFLLLNQKKIKGLRPSKAFTVKTFPIYLFKVCKDLDVIAGMLNVCKKNPQIIGQIDAKMKSLGDECLRDDFMLPFLMKMYHVNEEIAKMTLQLMGFSNVTSMRHFYEERRCEKDSICETLDEFDWSGIRYIKVDLENSSSDIYEYTNERF